MIQWHQGAAKLRYTVDGDTGPSVILIHELGGSLDSWDGVVARLKDQCHILRYDLRGAGQGYDSESGEYTTRKIKILLRGRPKEADLGKFDVGATTDSKTTLECDYIKIDIDGETKLELDKYNFICNVDGVDYLEDVRDALGM